MNIGSSALDDALPRSLARFEGGRLGSAGPTGAGFPLPAIMAAYFLAP